MSIPKTYNPLATENKWYTHWLDKNYFNSKPDNRESLHYCYSSTKCYWRITHGTHVNNTLQDVMIRRARMMGYNAVGFLEPIMHQLQAS